MKDRELPLKTPGNETYYFICNLRQLNDLMLSRGCEPITEEQWLAYTTEPRELIPVIEPLNPYA